MSETIEDLLPLVAELADKYTGRESTSIPYHTAAQLMGAVIYCIQEYQQGGREEAAFLSVKNRASVREAYINGYRMVLEKVERTRVLYHEILPAFCHYGNRAYQDTFEKGIPAFFIRYDARFQPQNHILTLDYPVLASLENIIGIDAVYIYVTCIGLEQKFLKRLPDPFIRHVLPAYHPEYEELFINVAGIVLRNLLGCILAGKEVNSRGYGPKELKRINTVIRDNTAGQLEELLVPLVDEVVSYSGGWDFEMAEYLKLDIHNFAFELKTAAEAGCLERILAIAGTGILPIRKRCLPRWWNRCWQKYKEYFEI